jgi:hypothetical protein
MQIHKYILGFLFISQAARVSASEIKTIYTWSYNDMLISMVYYFDGADYTYYKDQKRIYDDFGHYLKENPAHPVIQAFTEEFKLLAAEHDWSDWQLAECAISFVQSLKYRNDGTWEYPRFPIETLVEKGGDCEDLAMVLEAILAQLGFDCVLISPDRHMGVGIATRYPIEGAAFDHRGKNYYYIETTSAGWGIGDYPDNLSAGALIYDPGNVDAGIALSEYNYSFHNYTTPEEITATADNSTEQTDQNAEAETSPSAEAPVYNPKASKRPANTYTIDVDKVVIDGKKETVVTKVVEENGAQKVVADSE